jgi:hypothetical protein
MNCMFIQGIDFGLSHPKPGKKPGDQLHLVLNGPERVAPFLGDVKLLV